MTFNPDAARAADRRAPSPVPTAGGAKVSRLAGSLPDPLWRRVLGCLPVVSLLMQCVNVKYINHEMAANGRSIELLERAKCYEKCAIAGHFLTVIALAVFAVLAASNPFTTLLFLGAICLYGGAGLVTAKRLQGYDEELRNI